MRTSVIIPTYNRKDVLLLTLDSLKNQEFDRNDYEVIIVDDGSLDGTRDFLRDYDPAGMNFSYFSEKHKGPAHARNVGVKHAKGDLIIFIGDDTIPDKGFIKNHIEAQNVHPDSIIVGYTTWHPECRVTLFMSFLEQSGLQFSYAGLKKYQELNYNMFYTSNISLPGKLFNGDGFDENFPYAAFEDIEFGYRLKQRGVKMYYCPDAVCYHFHYYEDERMIFKRQRNVAESLAYFIKKHPEMRGAFIKKNRLLITMASRLLYSSPIKAINRNIYWMAGMTYLKYKYLRNAEADNL